MNIFHKELQLANSYKHINSVILQNLSGIRGNFENGDLVATYYLNSSVIILQLFIREGTETEFSFRFEQDKILFDLSSLIPAGAKLNPFTATIGTLKGITGTYTPLVIRFESKKLISKVPSFSAYCKGSFGTVVIPLI
ncbi:MAG: hypothetical protein ACRDDH_17755 [Cetobacterium sp.]|uniref:hypothetical protein n=1 Tax=Cetobacterium sp. TaxID=2071632 RepID=UPI003EE7A6F4